MPQLTLNSIRRCWKVNTEPPSSRITKGEGGTFGDARKCAEGDDMSENAARSGAGLRCGVPKVLGFRLREGDGPNWRTSEVCDENL